MPLILENIARLATSLLRGAARRRYSPVPICSSHGTAAGRAPLKEDRRERACSIPAREPLPGLPGRDLARHGSAISARGRQPRGEAAPREADRGQGRRRASPHDGRLLEGAHSVGRERERRQRAAPALLRELNAPVARAFAVVVALAAAGVGAAACDQGVQHDVPIVIGPPLHVVGFNGTVTKGTLPVDGYLQVAFDRLLDPASVTRQSFSLRDGTGAF